MATTEPTHNSHVDAPDIVLIGSGIMSATLGAMLKVLEPKLRLQMYEVTAEPAQESSHGWSNAGTGHAGLCELSYTPYHRADGSVDVSKALQIFEEFESSRQFWAFAVAHCMLPAPSTFIRAVPHLSFVAGKENVAFLKARYEALVQHPFFETMEYTDAAETVASWAPLLMQGRAISGVAATRVKQGTDVNFGALARGLVQWLAKQPGCGVATAHRVWKIRPEGKKWRLQVANTRSGANLEAKTPFVFIGAGGASLSLLQQTGISESRGIGGFPIGGQWLVCNNPEIVVQHHAKVYGQALGVAPTMAVPHLDTRILDDRRVLLFGPFAAWTSKFLHGSGSYLDLPRSIKGHNLLTLTNIGFKNLDLIRYLVQQGRQTKADRLLSLREFYPAAQAEDWRLVDAGIRVQAINRSEGKSGIVHYGTEVIANQLRGVAALLGASPGASVSVSITLNLIATCFPHLLTTTVGRERMRAMVPTSTINLRNPGKAVDFRKAREHASSLLQL